MGSTRRWVAAFVAAALLAGCGSTVSKAERAASGRLSDAAADLDAAGDESPATTAIDGATRAGEGVTSGGGTRSRPATGSAGATTRNFPTGPGVSATTINIGLSYAVNSGAANAALGATNLSQGDPKRTAEILIEDINAKGGVAGRKLVPVWNVVDGATTAPYDVIAQQACDAWTQDNKVFMAAAGGNDTLLQCLEDRGVVAVQDDLTNSDAAAFRRYPHYVEISAINLDRLAAAEVTALNAQSYFAGWNAATGAPSSGRAKVGIVTFDSRSFGHATDAVLVPALARIGYAPAPEDIRRIQTVQRTSDTGPIAAAAANAVLKLRSSGVTHVIILDESGVLSLLFMQSAESQGYRPRYGLNTQNGPQALSDGNGLPRRQLVGSKGVGWLPSLDIPPAQNTRTGPYSNPARRRCYDLLTSKGQAFSDPNAETIAMAACSVLWFFRDAVKASGDVLNRDAFMAGLATLGTSFQATTVFATRFSATQHDGVAAFRHYAYDAGCTCMRYTSGNLPV